MQPQTVSLVSKTPSISITQASESDLDKINQWTLQLHFHEDDGVLKMHSNFESNLKSWLNNELTNPNGLFLIAKVEQNPVGFIFCNSVVNDNGFLAEPVKGVIHLLWVDESYRKQNIAAMLLAKAEECLSSVGIKYIECSYTSKNNLARSFWDKNGYQQFSITARKCL